MAETLGRRLTLAAVAACSTWFSCALAADAAPPQIMVIGTFHFANAGQHVVNMKVIDVLMPERQREIAAVVRNLARFEPTKVGVEWPAAVAQEDYLLRQCLSEQPSVKLVDPLSYLTADAQ